MKTIRWGMIGCGSVTEVKSGPAFNKAPHSKLIAVMRRDAEKVKQYAERHQVPYYFTDANELINHPEVDAVYIATPPKSVSSPLSTQKHQLPLNKIPFSNSISPVTVSSALYKLALLNDCP